MSTSNGMTLTWIELLIDSKPQIRKFTRVVAVTEDRDVFVNANIASQIEQLVALNEGSLIITTPPESKTSRSYISLGWLIDLKQGKRRDFLVLFRSKVLETFDRLNASEPQ